MKWKKEIITCPNCNQQHTVDVPKNEKGIPCHKREVKEEKMECGSVFIRRTGAVSITISGDNGEKIQKTIF